MGAARSVSVFVFVVIFLFVASTAPADDLTPPSYRGQSGYTTQEWDFMTSGFEGAYIGTDGTGGISYNPYGTSMAAVAGGAYLSGTGPGPGGAWQGFQQIACNAPNSGVDFTKTKNCRVQVTYYDSYNGTAPTIIQDYDSSEWTRQYASTPTSIGGSGWYYYYEDWTCTQCTSAESILFNNPYDVITEEDEYNAYAISEIVIDTVCVPEPASIVMLVAAGGLLIRRRRR